MSERQYAIQPGWYWVKWKGQYPVIKYLAEVNGRIRMDVEGEWRELPLGADVRGPLENPFDGSDILQKQIEEAVVDRWSDVRNKIIDKLQDRLTDEQLQEVLQIVDDEQWFPRFEKAIRKGEEA